MPATIEPTAALIAIDFQEGILALPTAVDSGELLARSEQLTANFLPAALRSATGFLGASEEAFMAFPPATDVHESDVVITKLQWSAFWGTELDRQLRRRGVGQIVLTGVATSMGVESTVRDGWELGYRVVVVEDATSDMNAAAHHNSVTRIFPHIAQVTDTATVIASLDSTVGETGG